MVVLVVHVCFFVCVCVFFSLVRAICSIFLLVQRRAFFFCSLSRMFFYFLFLQMSVVMSRSLTLVSPRKCIPARRARMALIISRAIPVVRAIWYVLIEFHFCVLSLRRFGLVYMLTRQYVLINPLLSSPL